jgi:hypothetical protein
MVELSEYVPINLICVAALAALGLRRLVRMDGHHWTRVVILTGLLWVPTIYLFVLGWSPLFPPYPDSCVTTPVEPRVFCITE